MSFSGIPIQIKNSELTIEQFKNSNIIYLVSQYLLKIKKEITLDNIKAGVAYAFSECRKEFSSNHFAKNIIYYKIKDKTPEKQIIRENCNVTNALDKILAGKSDEISIVSDSNDLNLKISNFDEFISHPGISGFFNGTHVPNKFPDKVEEMKKKWPTIAGKFYEKYKVDESFQSIIHRILEIYEKYQKELENIQIVIQMTETPKLGVPEVVPDKSLQIEEAGVPEVVPDKSLQIEEALVLEETLHTQQLTNSPDPLMNSTQIKSEISQRKSSSSENSVWIIEQSPEKPIIIEDSILMEANSQTDTDESILGKAERKALQELQFE